MNKEDKPVIIWLGVGCFLIAAMVIVGGITRLTHSGLSIVEWNLLMGSIPPLNKEEWMEVFDKYKSTPEFILVNYNFSLEEFKSIYWWEYIHRMLGRFIGLVFIIPFGYLMFRKRLSNSLIRKLLIVFALGSLQAFLGWYMVKSGLVRDPTVSHYRLASHLIIALALYGYILVLVFDLIFPTSGQASAVNKPLRKVTVLLLIITFVQFIYGAFMSGLKAGKVYNTFPKMGSQWIADSVGFSYKKDGLISLMENLASVQFIHRYLAVFILILVLIIWRKSRNISTYHIKIGANLLLIIVIAQFLLGVMALLFAVPVLLGVLHQFGALVFLTAIIYYWHNVKSFQN
ncbi:MAG: heme A synthase [Bacteroidetes bacterium]|nr:MAG: heme A synthase [Bacteroidota bacterium]